MQYVSNYLSPIGRLFLASDGKALTGLSFEGDKHLLPSSEQKEVNLPIFDQTKIWLDCYFRGERQDFYLPITLDGTPFRLLV